jgi:hypothetical protein
MFPHTYVAEKLAAERRREFLTQANEVTVPVLPRPRQPPEDPS